MRVIYRRDKINNVVFTIVNTTFMILLMIVTLYPFLNTVAISFNQADDTMRGGIGLWPRILSLQNYKAVFISGTIYNAFIISVLRTVLSVITNIFLTTMLAYVLSRQEYIFRKIITIVFVLTMYFNAGLIPNYFLIRDLGLINNFWVYVLPSMVNAFNLIVIRTYIRTIPESFIESAKMDGAGDFRIFLQIIFPLCTPVLATITLFVAVGSWNMWFDTFLYASSKQSLSTLQYELMKLLSSSISQSTSAMATGGGIGKDMAKHIVTPTAIRAAATIVASVPILLVYPFLQKHFVKGLKIGGIKE
jgi:putative aldouronate transport system permease protein